MLKQSPIAKITSPGVPAGVVRRERLFYLLDKCRKKPVVWISGPGGSGKTTLVSSYLETRKLPAIWNQVDEGDADPATFFYYMGLAFNENVCHGQDVLPLLTPECLAGIKTFTRRYFEKLFMQLPAPYAIVLDNYQEVPEESLFHEVVRDGLSVVPEGVAAVIVSRAGPPAVFSRLLMNGQMEVVDWEEIRFTLEESRELVGLRAQNLTSEEMIGKLYRQTEGWAAGLVLLAESSARGSCISGLSEIPHARIFDYFATELFGHANDEIRRFLITTAFLPRMTARAVEDLTGDLHAGRRLTGLSRNNFFIQCHATPELVYQYHPLFRAFLLQWADELLGNDEKMLIRNKAALLLLQMGETEDAARLLIEIADWRAFAALVCHAAQSFISDGRFMTVESWLDHFPAEMVARDGWLMYWKAQCRLTNRPAEARRQLEQAVGLFRSLEDAKGAFLALASIVDTYLYEWRDFRPLDGWLEEFGALMKQHGEFSSAEVDERATSAMFTALMFRQPHHPNLPYWESRVRSVIENTSDVFSRVLVGNNLALYYLFTGRIAEAGALVAMLSPVLNEGQGSPLHRLMWLRTESLYCFYVMQPEAGLRAVARGLRLADETGMHLLDLMFYGVGIYHAAARNDTALAEEYLERMTSVFTPGSSTSAAIYHTVQSSLVSLLMGDIPRAVGLVERSVRLAEEAGAPLIVNNHTAQMTFVLTEGKQFDGIAARIDALRNRGKAVGSTNSDAWCACFEAQVAMRDGDDDLFAERFGHAVAVSKRTGLRFLALLPATVARLCAKALDLGIETEFAKELIRLYRVEPEIAKIVTDAWPWPLKIHTLGSFEILKDDKPVAVTGKVKKPLEFLKALIALGGKNVSEERLTDVLWPDAEGDLAQRSFDTTLHRLRKLLDNDKALQHRAGRLSIDPRHCWVDTWAFERQCGEIEDGLDGKGQRKDIDRIALRFEKAADLYRGHFLHEDTDQPWTASMREHLRSRYLHLIGSAGGCCEALKQWENAAGWYRKGLLVDGLAEEFYQRLMVCFRQQGQTVQAVKVYQRCRSALSAGLDLAPSPKTEEIYSTLVKKR